MSYLDWHVGMKIVCVDGSPRVRTNLPPNDPEWQTEYPVEGKVYTIRKISASHGRVSVLLNEIRNNPRVRWADGYIGEALFLARRFRKVQPRKTDISCFVAILNGHRVPEDA